MAIETSKAEIKEMCPDIQPNINKISKKTKNLNKSKQSANLNTHKRPTYNANNKKGRKTKCYR